MVTALHTPPSPLPSSLSSLPETMACSKARDDVSEKPKRPAWDTNSSTISKHHPANSTFG